MKAFEALAAGNFEEGISLLGQDEPWKDTKTDLNGPFYLGFPGASGWGEGLLVASLLKRNAVHTQTAVPVFAVPEICSILRKDASFKTSPCKCFKQAADFGARSPLAVLRSALIGDLLDKKFQEISLSTPKRRKIGIAWASVANEKPIPEKSIPLENLLTAIKYEKDMEFVSFQRGTSEDEVRQFLTLPTPVTQIPDSDLDNREDLTAVVQHVDSLDAMVTISATTAHIAAAMGKPTFVIAARRKGSQWFWLAQKDHGKVFYPNVTVFLGGDPKNEKDWWNKPLRDAVAKLQSL